MHARPFHWISARTSVNNSNRFFQHITLINMEKKRMFFISQKGYFSVNFRLLPSLSLIDSAFCELLPFITLWPLLILCFLVAFVHRHVCTCFYEFISQNKKQQIAPSKCMFQCSFFSGWTLFAVFFLNFKLKHLYNISVYMERSCFQHGAQKKTFEMH